MMIAFRSPPSSTASSQPQHAAGPNYVLGLTCILGGHLTAWMSQILFLLPVQPPILPSHRNHQPSPRRSASSCLTVREPSFDALDWGHMKARRHLPSSLSSTADDVVMPRQRNACIFDVFRVWGGGRTRDPPHPKPASYHYAACSNHYFLPTRSSLYILSAPHLNNYTLQQKKGGGASPTAGPLFCAATPYS